MPDLIRDLLNGGIAAARAGQGHAARALLKRVLAREDAASGQRVEAWLWLSEVGESPEEKRKCLEEALAIDPSNLPARRGLALLDGQRRSQDISDRRRLLNRIGPAMRAASSAPRRTCTECGGMLIYTPERRALVCQGCGRQVQEPSQDDDTL